MALLRAVLLVLAAGNLAALSIATTDDIGKSLTTKTSLFTNAGTAGTSGVGAINEMWCLAELTPPQDGQILKRSVFTKTWPVVRMSVRAIAGESTRCVTPEVTSFGRLRCTRRLNFANDYLALAGVSMLTG